MVPCEFLSAGAQRNRGFTTSKFRSSNWSTRCTPGIWPDLTRAWRDEWVLASRGCPQELPPPARAEQVESAAEQADLRRRDRPPVDLALHPEAVDHDGLLDAVLADAVGAVAVGGAALPDCPPPGPRGRR